MKVLVTDGDNRAALAITRSLGREGHTIIVGDRGPRSLAGASRFAAHRIVYPDPVRHPSAFADRLPAIVAEHGIELVLPVSDITTQLVAEAAPALPDTCILPFPPPQTIQQTADKAHVTRLAQELGIDVPSTRILQSAGDLAETIDGLVFPVVVKPSRSRVRNGEGWLFTGVSYANDPAELRAIIAGKPAIEFPVLLQERITGPGLGVFACYDRGRLIAQFSHQRLREKPPSGGVSVLRESIAVDPVAGEFAHRLLIRLGWHGAAMVEFKLDRRDGRPKLMEINGRFWGSLQLAIDAGVDFPAIIARMAQGRTIEPILSYRTGVQSRWLWGDIDALLMVLFKSRARLRLPPDHPGRLVYLARFLRLWGRDMHYEVLSRDDLKPWLYESLKWIKLMGK